ncbi:retrovirus-related pol polyprotein from transposon tnt 1-94, partial [Lasius niger]
FQDYNEDSSHNVAVASGQKLSAYGIGKVVVSTKDGPKSISNVVYVPELKTIYSRLVLTTVSKMIKNDHVVFNSTVCQVYDAEDCSIKGEVVVTASNHNSLYRLDTISQEVNLTKHTDSEDIWHKRLGHLNRVSMNLLKQGLATGVNFADGREIIHSDWSDARIFMEWKQICTQIYRRFFQKDPCVLPCLKSEVYSTFKDYQRMVEKEANHTIKVLRTD